MWSIVNVSEKLGCSQTKIKKLLSIKKWEPELLDLVDKGILSVEGAYQEVRLKYIVGENNTSYNTKKFKTSFEQLLKRYNPSFDIVFDLLMKHYPEEKENKS